MNNRISPITSEPQPRHRHVRVKFVGGGLDGAYMMLPLPSEKHAIRYLTIAHPDGNVYHGKPGGGHRVFYCKECSERISK